MQTDPVKGQTKKAIIIGGPTASGKTSLAIDVAKHFHTSIISCDSRQCYREMNIGVAKPSPLELEQVHHYFINSHSILEPVNAAFFEQYALQCAAEIFSSSGELVMVGGTGLYIKAFTEGIDHIPVIDPEIRNHVVDQYEKYGLKWLQEQVERNDPLYFSTGEIQNPQRLMRALEVKLGTGLSIREFQKQSTIQRDFDIYKFAINIEREKLVENINTRVDQMISNGLVEEVKDLLEFRHLPALQTVGYQELFEYFDGKCSLDEAIDRIRINTRQYAKRQMTWFRKHGFQWVHAGEVKHIIDTVSKTH